MQMKNGAFVVTPTPNRRNDRKTNLHAIKKTDIIREKGKMKKQFAILILGCTACGTAFGAVVDWWNKQTICDVNNTLCYASNTPGIDFSFEDGWDISGNCRGKKYICPIALTNGGNAPVTMERADIARHVGLNSDFDTDTYVASDNCYGARKTSQNGALVLINGEYVRVWCNGLLSRPTETVANGEIGPAPTCRELAEQNYVATLNGNCYGKYYDPARYSIDCDGETPVIVVLNGAQYTPNVENYITTFMANQRFSAMQTSAAAQRSIHFPK